MMRWTGTPGGTHDGRPGFEVAVAPGETLDGVARRLGASRDMLIEANRLHPPYELREHQILYVPPPATYRVQPDDTVEGIAVALGVDEAALGRGERPVPAISHASRPDFASTGRLRRGRGTSRNRGARLRGCRAAAALHDIGSAPSSARHGREPIAAASAAIFTAAGGSAADVALVVFTTLCSGAGTAQRSAIGATAGLRPADGHYAADAKPRTATGAARADCPDPRRHFDARSAGTDTPPSRDAAASRTAAYRSRTPAQR